jgi:predicted metal-dependent hydrolase
MNENNKDKFLDYILKNVMVSMKIEIEDKTLEFNVEYGKRKKIAIQMEIGGFIKVKAPKGTSEEIILKVVKQHAEWIFAKRDELLNLGKSPNPKEFHGGEMFLYLGKEHLLSNLINTDEIEEYQMKNKLKKFYFTECKKIVTERIKLYQKQLGVKPKVIEIEESKKKWGSCSSDKKITFNYRLAMAPIDVIDYVIIHELCHLVHMNHERSFWRLVGSLVPDYKAKQEFLARYGQHMDL